MTSARADAIASHVEAAKRILAELETHADKAMRALEQDGGAEFFAAVDERARVLSDLESVVEVLAHERAALGDSEPESAATTALLADMAQAAAAALKSHEQLVAQTQRERDRLAAAMHRATRPDSVALQYATAVSGPGLRTLSVTG